MDEPSLYEAKLMEAFDKQGENEVRAMLSRDEYPLKMRRVAMAWLTKTSEAHRAREVANQKGLTAQWEREKAGRKTAAVIATTLAFATIAGGAIWFVVWVLTARPI